MNNMKAVLITWLLLKRIWLSKYSIVDKFYYWWNKYTCQQINDRTDSLLVTHNIETMLVFELNNPGLSEVFPFE